MLKLYALATLVQFDPFNLHLLLYNNNNTPTQKNSQSQPEGRRDVWLAVKWSQDCKEQWFTREQSVCSGHCRNVALNANVYLFIKWLLRTRSYKGADEFLLLAENSPEFFGFFF